MTEYRHTGITPQEVWEKLKFDDLNAILDYVTILKCNSWYTVETWAKFCETRRKHALKLGIIEEVSTHKWDTYGYTKNESGTIGMMLKVREMITGTDKDVYFQPLNGSPGYLVKDGMNFTPIDSPIILELPGCCPKCIGWPRITLDTGGWIMIGCSRCGHKTNWYDTPNKAFSEWNGEERIDPESMKAISDSSKIAKYRKEEDRLIRLDQENCEYRTKINNLRAENIRLREQLDAAQKILREVE